MPVASGLTVVVPCYNEAAIVAATYAEISSALAEIDDLEILFIDDGSRDETLATVKSLAANDPRVRFVAFSRNFGLAAAVMAGFRYAGKPWIAQVDCDLQNPAAEIWKLLARAADGYDVVFGVRDNRQDPLARRWGSAAQQWFARRGLGIDVPPGASSFRVLRTGVARTLADLRLGAPYYIAMVPMVGARYACVPTAHRRREGKSRFRVTRLVGHTFELFFGYSWRPLNSVYLLAVLGLAAAVTLGGLAAAAVVGPGLASAAGLLLTAATLGAVGLIGRYLHRFMLDQRPGRPYYVREANVELHPEDRLDHGVDPVAPPTRRAARTLVVLGAGEEQVPLYQEAARRGLRTVAVDQSTDRPALCHADEHLHLSTRDPAPIAAALGERPVAGVVTTASDASLASWSALTARYRTPYRYPDTAARLSSDKPAFHTVAAAVGVDGYRWRSHRDPAVLSGLAADVGYPLIVKPVDASGSKGVTLVPGPDDLPAALAYAASFTVSGELLLEEYLDGRNLTVNVFLRGGRSAFTVVTEKRLLPGPHFVVGGHVCPAPLTPAVRDELEETAVRLCRAVGLVDGPANLDVILAPDGTVRVLEANLRLSGNSVPALVAAVHGVDLVAALVSLSLGEPADLTPTRDGVGIVHLLGSPLDTDGVLVGVDNLDAVRGLPGVVRCEIYAGGGSVVHPFTEGGHKIGHLVVRGDDLDAAQAHLAAALTMLHVIVEPIVASPEPTPTRPARLLVEGVPHAVA